MCNTTKTIESVKAKTNDLKSNCVQFSLEKLSLIIQTLIDIKVVLKESCFTWKLPQKEAALT